MSRDEDPPSKEQMAEIAKICGASGLFSCKVPTTRAEADRIIEEFHFPLRRSVRPRMIDSGKLWVGKPTDGG